MGCESSGQTGLLKAPKGASKEVQIDARTAQELAYYEAANGLGVLAPRGWHCYGGSGSSGVDLLVLRPPIALADWTANPARPYILKTVLGTRQADLALLK